jgi:hypothetical protein
MLSYESAGRIVETGAKSQDKIERLLEHGSILQLINAETTLNQAFKLLPSEIVELPSLRENYDFIKGCYEKIRARQGELARKAISEFYSLKPQCVGMDEPCGTLCYFDYPAAAPSTPYNSVLYHLCSKRNASLQDKMRDAYSALWVAEVCFDMKAIRQYSSVISVIGNNIALDYRQNKFEPFVLDMAGGFIQLAKYYLGYENSRLPITPAIDLGRLEIKIKEN